MGVGVAEAVYFEVGDSGLCRLGGCSIVVWWVGCGSADVDVCLVLIRVLGEECWGE